METVRATQRRTWIAMAWWMPLRATRASKILMAVVNQMARSGRQDVIPETRVTMFTTGATQMAMA